jgi:hypothetical protein
VLLVLFMPLDNFFFILSLLKLLLSQFSLLSGDSLLLLLLLNIERFRLSSSLFLYLLWLLFLNFLIITSFKSFISFFIISISIKIFTMMFLSMEWNRLRLFCTLDVDLSVDLPKSKRWFDWPSTSFGICLEKIVSRWINMREPQSEVCIFLGSPSTSA